jgi:DNA-binding transcriptional regulator YhcF (GntR family)
VNFDTGRSIYEQIVEFSQHRILTGDWEPGDRLPSVRELAIELGVNPNTVQRSYSVMQDAGVIFNQRGVGYFVAEDAPARARNARRSQFEKETLPRVFETMHALDYSIGDLEQAWTNWKGLTTP